jgi:hypothetical protein
MRETDKIDQKLKQWGTEKQNEYLDAVNEHGSIRAAGRALGVNYSTVLGAIRTLERRAAVAGYAPERDMTRPVPDGHVAGGVSTYYNKDGKVTQQWVKSKLDHDEREQLIRETIRSLADEAPRVLPTPAPDFRGHEYLCNVYTLTDCHVGMLAWHKEGGADWDLKIAEEVLTKAFAQMVTSAPKARVAVVNQLGDFLHQDSIMPMTPTSGHVLDADGRFSKVVQAAVRLLRAVVDLALQNHEEVVVLMAEGNHDISSSIWLRTLFGALYENEPRVKVIDSVMPYYVHEHGETMLAFHHGHLKKNDQLPLLFAAQFPKAWGNTTKRYCHVGHRHHVEEKEHAGMKVVQHSTLAARDAYASRGGWLSERQATAMTYHTTWGEVARITVTPEMFG